MRSLLFCSAAFLLLISCGTEQIDKPGEVRKYYPKEYLVPTPQHVHSANSEISIDLYSRSFAQGDVVYVEILSSDVDDISSVHAQYRGLRIPFTKKSWGYRGFFSIPTEMNPGENQIRVSYSHKGEKELSSSFNVADAHFKVFRSALDLGSFSDESKPLSQGTLTFIEESTKKKNKAFSEMIPDCISASLSHPRDLHFITSEFYSRRVYMRYKERNGKRIQLKEVNKIHSGMDLRGAEGTPVFAMTAGKVSLASPLYYEGNMIILNHGEGIYSYYMHMSKLLVSEGSNVSGGQKIGEVGSTGASTASHLHVSLVVHGFAADPLSLICLPIRD
ncbi:MAG TPA: M23 family metallopeptidase [Spirochaetota bacterium]